jgi:aspartate carbamoyltransferase catalytic subunit
MEESVREFKRIIDDIDFVGKNLISINDLNDNQIYKLFELAYKLEPWNKSRISLLPNSQMSLIFFQPSTRTRMSFQTAMQRLGGMVITETTPLITSSSAKEESLNDMMKVVSKYSNIIVLRHPDNEVAVEAVANSECPVISGGFGHKEHPTQSLLDLYTIWRTFGKIEGLKICIASPDLIHARTGHSMEYALARLGADLYLSSMKKYRTPKDVLNKVKNFNSNIKEIFDQTQDEFNDFALEMDLIYLPGCSAPAGEEAESFKSIMDNYYLRFETIKQAFDQKKGLYVTHTLPRRPGEMDLRIDRSKGELYFKALSYSISVRKALILAMVGL